MHDQRVFVGERSSALNAHGRFRTCSRRFPESVVALGVAALGVVALGLSACSSPASTPGGDSALADGPKGEGAYDLRARDLGDSRGPGDLGDLGDGAPSEVAPCGKDSCRNGRQDCGEADVDCGGACASCAATKADVYVDPLLGTDQGDGSRARPYRTLPRARDAVRLLRKATPGRQTPLIVALRGGTYWLDKTLEILPEDSGTAASPTVYRAFVGETPRVSGGRQLTGWKVDAQGRWHLTVPEVVSAKWVFTQLWVDGKRRWRPRLPKKGHYFIHRKVVPLGTTGGKDNRFGFRGAEIRHDWHRLGDVEVLAWHQWTISRLRIASVDPAKRVVGFTGTTHCTAAFCQLRPGWRYLVENVREALTEPGEWYLDAATGELTYLPMPGEKVAHVEIIAPRVEHLLSVGDASATPASTASHVTFEGISFAHTHWATPKVGYSSPQSEATLTAAITITNAHDIVLRGCTIAHTGAWAVHLGMGSDHDKVTSSTLTDLGAGGIRIGHRDHLSDETKVAQYHTISDDLITTGGRMHPAGVGVLITHGAHNTVEHNDIADFYYSGISVGWRWDYSPSNAHHNLIGYNHVHHIGQGVLSDMGGIYTLGISPGTRIHHNIFHDISRNRYGGWGIYFDQASSDIVADFNVVYDTQDTPFHLHFGEKDTLRNNIFVATRTAVLRRSKAETRQTLTVGHNILVTTDKDAQGGLWTDKRYFFDKNLYWRRGGGALLFGGGSFAAWQAMGQDVHSKIADPHFVDPKAFVDPLARDFRVAAGSPAVALGILPVDVTKAGRLSKPRSDDLPAMPRAFPAATGTFPIDIDFEEMVANTSPTIGELHPGDGSGGLKVTTQTAAHGTKQSLLLEDAANNTQAYDPHYVLKTTHGEGMYRLRFSLRFETGAKAMIEARDWRQNPYLVGPSLRIAADGKLSVGGQILATLLPGKWIDVEILVGLGTKATGTFTLSLTPAGGNKQVFAGLACGDAFFGYLGWFGFVSLSTTHTTFFIDEIKDAVL
ncbi:MAG: right-handed parallel beta-helix repeat-containing protein [Deltaproteobacteria bacterium]|nr:right-handed parallel beta-helix repeat-containing protein [Deltaproteobacteria bacterium]